MSEKSKNTQPNRDDAVCPHCGEPLHQKGKIVDTGNYKKWVEEWHCPTHGAVQPDDSDS